MADTFTVSGDWASVAASGTPNGYPAFTAPLSVRKTLESKLFQSVELASDPAVAVTFGTLTEAHVLIVVSTAKLKITVTSTDGTAQSFPCENTFMLINDSVPITALTIQRFAGQDTTANIFIGQQAA